MKRAAPREQASTGPTRHERSLKHWSLRPRVTGGIGIALQSAHRVKVPKLCRAVPVLAIATPELSDLELSEGTER